MFNYFPENISTYGGGLDSVYWMIFYGVGLWFLLTEGVLFYFIFRYRRKEGQKAAYAPGRTFQQMSWVLVPAALVMVLDLWIDFAGTSAYNAFRNVPAGDLVVQVTGKQYNWDITYPGPDGNFGTDDDLKIENELHVPVNKKVRLILKSEDVLHSFFVPVLRLKQDIIPGREIPAWFEATETSENTEHGYYEIACAELCGYGHYTMRGLLYVHTDAAYNAWLQKQWPAET